MAAILDSVLVCVTAGAALKPAGLGSGLDVYVALVADHLVVFQKLKVERLRFSAFALPSKLCAVGFHPFLPQFITADCFAVFVLVARDAALTDQILLAVPAIVMPGLEFAQESWLPRPHLISE